MVQSLSRFNIHLDAEEQALLFDRYDTLACGTVNMVRARPAMRAPPACCAMSALTH